MYGAIAAEYAATANETDAHGKVVQQVLGVPTTDETDVPGVAGARMETFQGGIIYWSPSTGAHVVYESIGVKYASTGEPVGFGLPISDETNAVGLPGVRVQAFHVGPLFTGCIYWSAATGAHLVYGAIGAEHNATANEHDQFGNVVQAILGAPTSDEMDVPGVPGARMNTFQGGAIYFSPSTGTHVVFGAFYTKYVSLGGPTSFLGLSTSDLEFFPDEQHDNMGRVVHFEHGEITWTPAEGLTVIGF